MGKKTLLIVLVIGIAVYGCVSVPDRPVVLGWYDTDGTMQTDCFDDNGLLLVEGRALAQQTEELDSKGFRLLNWNSYKGSRKGWDNDLERLSRNSDILVLQEGYLTDSLKDLLNSQHFRWDIASAFTYYDIPAGVLTASRVQPESLCSFWVTEPISDIPKTVLITRYPLSGTGKTLLLANLHMVNFTLDNTVYRLQLERTARVLLQHDGPFIIAGDFNSWSDRRMTILNEITEQLSGKPVTFPEDKRTRFMGNFVDHIYYRGLVPVNSLIEEVSTSDHNPMLVTFKLADEN